MKFVSLCSVSTSSLGEEFDWTIRNMTSKVRCLGESGNEIARDGFLNLGAETRIPKSVGESTIFFFSEDV